jgi:SNF2 family DNA or RNA helicase
MKEQEAGPIKGGLLALDCGMGKTISTLMHITKQAEQVEAQVQAGKAVDCRATLVLCPNSIVDVWYKEWRTFFQNVLYFRQFYGNATDDLDIARKDHAARQCENSEKGDSQGLSSEDCPAHRDLLVRDVGQENTAHQHSRGRTTWVTGAHNTNCR